MVATMIRSLVILSLVFFVSVFCGPTWAETDVERCGKAMGANNFIDAYPVCLKAAEQGYADAQLKLGCIYVVSKKDYAQAKDWYRKAAEQGYAKAQYNLGVMLEGGSLCECGYLFNGELYAMLVGEITKWRVTAEALSWYKKAATQGFSVAQFKLGLLYSKGDGVPKNYSEAAKWYRKAAEQGHTTAQNLLGESYKNGLGVSKDIVRALAWYTLASANNKDAAKNRDEVEKGLSPLQITQAQQLATKYQREIDQSAVTPRYTIEDDPSDTNYPTLSLPAPTKTAFGSNDIAVIIGIEKYRSIPTTEFAAADAAMVRDYLRALGIPERNIEFLANERATHSDIRKIVETKLPNIVKPDSRVIVYYAGHGSPHPTNGTAYLVPYDGDPAYLADTAYSIDRLYEKLAQLPAKEVLVVLDACFSGSGGRSVLPPTARSLVVRPKIAPKERLIVLSSTQDNQITTTLPEMQHGLFTYFFLRALQEGKKDIVDVYEYLKPLVADEAKRRNVDQTPTISPSPDMLRGRFAFTR
jgi:hypothetical protein